MRVAVGHHSTEGPSPCMAVVLNAAGEEISRLWMVTAADDSTPQFPGGEPGVFEAWVDVDGELLQHKDWKRSRHLAIFPCPGLRITEAAG